MTVARGSARSRPALAAGERIYVVGRQDASFPPSGWHLPGEMGGVWAHPVRLARGFTVSLGVDGGRPRVWRATAYRQERLGARYRGPGPGGVRVERRDHAAADAPVLWVRLRVWAPADRPVRVRLRMDLLPHLRPVWPMPEPEAPQTGPTAPAGATRVWTRDGTGAVAAALTGPAAVRADGDPERGRWQTTLSLLAGTRADLHFLVAAPMSDPDGSDAAGTLTTWWREHERRVAARAHAEADADRSGRVRLGDGAMTRALADVGRSTRWLVCTVPGVGRGLTAGLADYPWWFGCDGAYIALGLLGAGQPALARDTLEVVARAGRERSSAWPRIPHEVTTRGQVVHPGNPVETAHWVWAACHYVRFTGDLAFGRRHYGAMRAGLAALLATGPLPSGFGIMEIEGLDQRLVDTAAYTWAALRGLAGLASDLGRLADAARLTAQAQRVRTAVETGLWLDGPGVYADWRARAPAAAAVAAMRAYARRRGGAMAEARVGGALLALSDEECASRPFGNWAALTPLAVGLAGPERARRALAALRRSPARVPSGLRLSESVRERPMTISTLVAAAAAARYGSTDLAMAFLRAVTDASGRVVPRAVSECLPEGGCFVQGWTLYARWVVVSDLIGLEVDAVRRRLTLRQPGTPPPPAQVRDLPIGDARLSLRAADGACSLQIDRPDWTVGRGAGRSPATLAVGRWVTLPARAGGPVGTTP